MGLLDPPGFRRNRHGQVWLHLPDQQRTVLRDLLEQLDTMLTPPEPEQPVDPLAAMVGIDPLAVRPADPALARLFPDAYTDPEAADEFRRFTMHDLRTGKRDNAATARATLEATNPTRLTVAECHAWLGALNDLRLTLGTRLAITEDESGHFLQMAEDDPQRAMYLVYDWLTYLQDRLVTAVSRGLRG